MQENNSRVLLYLNRKKPWMTYILIGITLHRFIYASFSNAVFDRFINSRMEGVRVNRGLAEDDEEYEDEETETEEAAAPAGEQPEN